MARRYPDDERVVAESPKVQGTGEARAYSFDFTGCGVTTIASQSAAVFLDGVDVTDSLMPGSATVSGLVVTTPKLGGLTAGKIYHLYARVTHDGGQVTELLCRVIARV